MCIVLFCITVSIWPHISSILYSNSEKSADDQGSNTVQSCLSMQKRSVSVCVVVSCIESWESCSDVEKLKQVWIMAVCAGKVSKWFGFQGLQRVPHRHNCEVCGEDVARETGSGWADWAAQGVQASEQCPCQHGQLLVCACIDVQ